MNRNTILAFLAGALIGGVLTHRYAMSVVKADIKETPDDRIFVTEKAKKIVPDNNEEKTPEPEKSSLDLAKRVRPSSDDYTNYVHIANDYKKEDKTTYKEKKSKADISSPYVISPDEGGEEYELIELKYYEDDVLLDDCDFVIDPDEIELIVGTDFHQHFGEYDEPDSVYIRNDSRKADYVILKQVIPYSEVEKTLPVTKRRERNE